MALYRKDENRIGDHKIMLSDLVSNESEVVKTANDFLDCINDGEKPVIQLRIGPYGDDESGVIFEYHCVSGENNLGYEILLQIAEETALKLAGSPKLVAGGVA